MDGYVIIGTGLDTKQLEQDLKNAKKELAQFQKEEEKLLKEKGKIETDLTAFEEEKASIKANTKEMMKQVTTQEQKKTLLEMEKLQLDEVYNKYSKQFSSIDTINSKLEENKLQQGLINGKIDEANNKLASAKGYENVKGQLGKINDKTSQLIKKVGKWALAVFSIRSAYMFVRQIAGTLAQYNEEFGTKLEYLRYALAQAIAPVLEYLVNLAYKLLSYVNYIVNAWFGINLFSKASAKNFQSMAGSASSISKSLQSAGFDEMEVLSDTSSSGGGIGGSSGFDLSEMNGEMPYWVQWIAKNKDGIITFLKVLAGLLIALKLGKLLKDLVGIGDALKGLKGMSKTLLNLAIVIVGVTLYAGSIGKILKGDTSLSSLLQGLAGAGLLGKGATALLGLSGPIGWKVALALALIVGIAWLSKKDDQMWSEVANKLGFEWDGTGFWAKYKARINIGLQAMGLKGAETKEMQKFLDTTETGLEKIGKAIKNVGKWFSDLWESIKTGLANMWNAIKKFFISIPNWISDNVITPISIFFVNLWNGIVEGVTSVWNKIVSFIIGIPDWIYNNVIKPIGNFFSGLWNGIKDTFASVWNWILGAFSKGGKIFNGIKEGIVSVFKTAVNGVISGINRVMSSALGGLNSILNKIKSIQMFGYKPFDGLWGWNPVRIPQIPRLAVGGIINMPRKRNISRWSNDRRSRSRRCNSINR